MMFSENEKLITRTTLPLSCRCGHMGAISKETSNVYAKAYWENYTSHYLRCNKELFTRRKTGFAEAIDKLKPACPRCEAYIS